MARRRIRRNAATTKGILLRVESLELEEVPDPRAKKWVVHPLLGVLKLLLFSLMSGSRSLRKVEDRSEQLNASMEAFTGLRERVSDNALGDLLPRLSPAAVVQAMQRGIRAEWRRKGLLPVSLPWNVVAVDGKHLATIAETDLRRMLDDDPAAPGSATTLRMLCSARFPDVQIQDGAGGIVGLVRVHNVTLVSSAAAAVIHQRPVAGKTNEIGSMPAVLEEVYTAYGRTGMLEVFTLDAGNTSQAVAAEIQRRGGHYLGRIESNHGDIYQEGVRSLGSRTLTGAHAKSVEKVNGAVVEHFLWREELPQGELAWTHARQRLRIERHVTDAATGEVVVGNRYVVTSMPPTKAAPEALLEAVRAHWRIENETHWTADAIWKEDRRRTPWTKQPTGILVTAALRAIAMTIMAQLRALSRYIENPDASDEDTVWLKPTWETVIELVLMLCFVPHLDTAAFDTPTT